MDDVSFSIRRMLLKRIRCRVAVSFVGLLLLWLVVANAAGHKIDLTDEEKTWLERNPHIKLVTTPEQQPFFILNADGTFTGIQPDLFDRLNRAIGQEIILESVTSSYHVKAKEKGIYGSSITFKSPENQKDYLLTDPYAITPFCIFTTKKNLSTIRGPNDLKGKKVVVHKSSRAHIKYLDDIGGVEMVIVSSEFDASSELELMQKVSSGEADAMIGYSTTNYLIYKYLMVDIRLAFIAKKEIAIHIGVNLEYPVLLGILNKAIATIDEKTRQEIFAKWTKISREKPPAILLTDEENAWLKAHPGIELGFTPDIEPLLIADKNGNFSGLLPELFDRFEAIIGVDIGIEIGPLPDIVQKARNREIDGLMACTMPLIKASGLLPTRPHHTSYAIVFAKNNGDIRITGKKDLRGKRVAYLKGTQFWTQWMEPLGKKVQHIKTDNFQKGYQLLQAGKTDVILGSRYSLYTIDKYGLADIKPIYMEIDRPIEIRTGIRSDWPELVSILNKALDALGPAELNALAARWLRNSTGHPSRMISLTDSEKVWVNEHPLIRLASDYAWPPFETIDEAGNYRGIAADHIKLIEERLGIRFEISPRKPWSKIVEMVRDKKLDLFTCAMETEQRKKFTLFTQPYISHPMVIVTRDNIDFVDGLEGLRKKKVAAENGYASFELISAKHPEIDLHPYPDAKSAMLALSKGEVFAYIGNIVTMSQVARSKGVTNIKVSGELPYRFELALGVRNDWPVLASILQKALNSIPEEEKANIFQKWISIDLGKQFDYTLFWRIAFVAAIVFGLFLFWNRRLAREVAVRKRTEIELNKAREVAETANRAKSQFLANMSHELRTPLNAVLGYTQILSRDDRLVKDQVRAIQTIHRSSEHLLSMINDLLDLSKIEAMKLSLDVHVFHLPQVLYNMIEIMEVRASEKKINFIYHISPDLPELVSGDEKRLKQILLNLLSNAMKFTDEGQVEFTAAAGVGETGKIRFEIKDTGIGIPADKLEDIFLPFQQAGGPKDRVEGTGLGLAITRSLIRMMGDDLHVKSTVGEGSRFWFESDLPASARSAASENRVEWLRVIGFRGERQRLLIVDDTPDNRFLLTNILSTLGFETEEAVDGRDGIAKALSFKPHLIFMDLVLPEMGGIEAVREIRRTPDLRDVVIVAVSASADEQTRRKCIAECDAFLPKPVQLDELLGILKNNLDIEWLYKEEHPANEMPDEPEAIPMVFPPDEELAVFWKAAKICNVTELRKCTKNLQLSDARYMPFATRIDQYTEAFRFEKIIEFIEPAIKRTDT